MSLEILVALFERRPVLTELLEELATHICSSCSQTFLDSGPEASIKHPSCQGRASEKLLA